MALLKVNPAGPLKFNFEAAARGKPGLGARHGSVVFSLMRMVLLLGCSLAQLRLKILTKKDFDAIMEALRIFKGDYSGTLTVESDSTNP